VGQLPSLRLWLQSTSLLAVLAGYTLLLVLNQALAGLQRVRSHQDLVGQLTARVSPDHRRSLPGLAVETLPGHSQLAPQLLHSDGQTWLVSVTPLAAGADGAARSLKVSQNVTASVQSEQLAQLLLIAAAGASTLLTGALLRPVLHRGLVQPLAALTSQINALEPPPAPSTLLPVQQQPQELRPIATAFNAMQQRLASSWEQQRAFVDGVAHELRTPLTLISGHAQSLRRHAALAATPEAAASLQLITAEAHRMGLLVSDLLDLARRDAGRLSLTLQPLNIDDALFESFERLAASSRGRLQLLTADSSGDTSADSAGGLPLVLADPDRLQQCLAALIDNALRYSPAPRPVQLSAAVVPDGLVVQVRDHGLGVAPDERERIFERFVRGQAAAETRGSGIGLSVVRLLVEAMGGTVQVVDAPGGGAAFQLRLRLA
jgi:two-component system, OmpR family, sensor kinase